MEKVKEIIRKVWKWVGSDGFQHCCVSIVLVAALGWVRPVWVVPIVVLAIGIAKEVKDNLANHRVWKDSLHDLACDAVGIGLGMLFIYLNTLAK